MEHPIASEADATSTADLVFAQVTRGVGVDEIAAHITDARARALAAAR